MPRKRRFEYHPENTAPDGHYIVGKARPPEHGKFRKGDGRKRGRRPKGTKNLATDLHEELNSSVSVTVGGVVKKVSRQRAILMRLADNATKGQTSAIALTLDFQQRLVDPLLQREAAEKQRERDLSRLTDLELEVLLYLTARTVDLEENCSDLVGFVPIYKEGEYLDSPKREAIAAGLKAYGIEPDESVTFPPRCRLISEGPIDAADADRCRGNE